MKLGDIKLLEDASEVDELRELLRAVNGNAREYPRNSTVHAEFSLAARHEPTAPAVVSGAETHTYAELEATSNRIARLLIRLNVAPEGLVGVLLEDTWLAAAALLGILKAGCAYLPLDGDAPRARLAGLLDETEAKVLISEKRFVRLANQLQWDCPELQTIVCPNTRDFAAETESGGEFMDERIWDMVGDEMFDDISGGGWKDSFTGEWLSRQVMDEYAMNIRRKLEPLLDRSKRVLEIGCASGISLFKLAPLCGRYLGTDLSARILAKTQRSVEAAGLTNVSLAHLAADQTHLVPEDGFDLVILNSVVQCFSGHNYLRRVLRQAIGKMGPRGFIFLGDLSDLDLKARFIEDLKAFERANAGKGYRTQTDRSAELYISRAFLNDLRHEMPEIVNIEFSRSLGTAPCEMVRYGFDALIRIDKTKPIAPPVARGKLQLDVRDIEEESAEAVPERAGPSHLAYVIYTSGTTGRPKGSAVPHRAILRLAKNSNFVPLNRQTCLLRTGALSFDASTLEFWGTLLNGGQLCHAPPKSVLDSTALRRLIGSHGVNTMWFTAALFNRLADDDPGVFTGLRYVLAGGERLSPPHIEAVRSSHPGLTLINGYGPTENTVFTTTHTISRNDAGEIPIGRPVANTQVYICDGASLTPLNTQGELCAAGDGLARGYWKNSRLTAERFSPNPEGNGDRLYRTGDLARWLSDGNIEFIGRVDDQVKVRGFRIELGEIELCMIRHSGILQAVVAATGDGPYGKELSAWFTSAAPVEEDSLRRHLAATLPAYMIPADFTRIDRFPLTKNGKVDRRALPKPDRRRAIAGVQPEGETEKRLIAIWERVLDRPVAGTTSNFFELGGHSLKVPKLTSAIREELGVDLPLMAIFRTPTIRGLTQHLIEQARFGVVGADDPLVRLNFSSAPMTLFAFPPGRGDALGYTGLARALDGFVGFFGFNFIPRETRLAESAEAILAQQPDGPYTLFGYSAGGRLAYHVAAELERRGKRVAAVIMADSSRYLAPIPFSREEVDRITAEFMSAEDVRPYLGTGILRDKAARLIRSYYDYIYKTVDSWTINADIHLLTCEGALTVFKDEGGNILASNEAWIQATRGRFVTHQGTGSHNDMFNQPWLDGNAALLKKIIASIRTEGT